MKHIRLNGTWKLYFFPQGSHEIEHPDQLAAAPVDSVPAQVPGNVELDLWRAKMLPDPYTGAGVLALRKYELYEWWYEKEFDVNASDLAAPVELHFHGVDCIATYWLNGHQIGESDNMLIPHAFPVRHALRPGKNVLHVRLRSPILEAADKDYDVSMWAMEYNWPQLWVRKAAHGFGWDIMPRAVSAGLWRDVELVVRDAAEISDLYLFTRQADENRATVGIFYQLKIDPALYHEARIRVEGVCGGSGFQTERLVHFRAGSIDVAVDRPELWWPRGYGKANLYEVKVQLLHQDTVLAERTETFGIRTVELERTEVTSPESPGQFLFRINGMPIFCKGSNWVPADMFHSRDAQRIPQILDWFVDTNCNIVRVWGGGVYEDRPFFERCDREGLMVWQDFAFGCALYPQSDEFLGKVEREARAIVRKLRNHPSLVLWCGDNENDYFSMSVRGQDPNGNRITREVIPEVIRQCDPYRPYLPSSPYYSPEVWAKKNTELLPEDHLWGPRDYYKSRYYMESKAHFVSEIGYHGCPDADSIRRFIDPEHVWPWPNNEQWALHSSDPIGLNGVWAKRIELMANQVAEMFGNIPDKLEDFVIASQISQAEAKKFFVERARLLKWRRTGIIWWNMADGWPQFSDAVVDYYGSKKLAYYYLKQVQQDVCIMIDEPSNWHVRVVVGNDTPRVHSGTFTVSDADSGDVLLEGPFRTKPNTNTELGRIRISHSDQKLFLIRWEIDGKTYGNHYLLGFPAFSLEKYKEWLPLIRSGFAP